MGLEFLDEELEHNLEKTESGEMLENGVILEHIGEQKESDEGQDLQGELGESEYINGDPEQDMENWHMQDGDMSCAVVCQEFVAEQLLDRDFSEQEFANYAEEMGWYDPETGTTLEDIGKLLESLGLNVERQAGVTFSELSQMLDNGEKVIVGVNNMMLAYPELANIPGYTANHAVEVIGVDSTDPNNVKVILNDPGVPNGQGIEHDFNTFYNAWSTSGFFAVSARKE